MRLTEEDGGTRLDYEVEVQIRGKIAQLGSRLVSAFAKSTSKAFFERFSAALAPEGDGQAEAAASVDAGAG